MKINKKGLGLALGLVWALTIFIVTLWASAKGQGATLAKLNGYYWGYSISFGGALLGLIWGFISGYLFGWALAYFYNILDKEKETKKKK